MASLSPLRLVMFEIAETALFELEHEMREKFPKVPIVPVIVDAEIVYIGLRPGEKLHEELVVEGEDVVRTPHPKVMKMIGDTQLPEDWARQLNRLIDLAIQGDRVGVVRQLKVLVKGYTPGSPSRRTCTFRPPADYRAAVRKRVSLNP